MAASVNPVEGACGGAGVFERAEANAGKAARRLSVRWLEGVGGGGEGGIGGLQELLCLTK